MSEGGKPCADCGREMRLQRSVRDERPAHIGRGLCTACYSHHREDGTLIDFPRASHSRADVVEDYELLSSEGHTRAQIAQRLGIQDHSLYRALRRAAGAS